MKALAYCLLVMPLACCTSLRAPPLPTYPETMLCSPAPKDANAVRLCGTLVAIQKSRGDYATRYSDLADEKQRIDGLLILATVAGAGFTLFEAHPDNIKAAALIAGTAGIVGPGLKYPEQLKLARTTANALNCYAGAGSTMVGVYLTPSASTTKIQQAMGKIEDALIATKNFPQGPGDAAAVEELPALKEEAEALLKSAARAVNALVHFNPTFEDSLAQAYENFAKRHDALEIDAVKLAGLIKENADTLNKPVESKDPPLDPNAKVAASFTEAVAELRTAIREMNELPLSSITTAFDRVPVCLAQSTN